MTTRTTRPVRIYLSSATALLLANYLLLLLAASQAAQAGEQQDVVGQQSGTSANVSPQTKPLGSLLREQVARQQQQITTTTTLAVPLAQTTFTSSPISTTESVPTTGRSAQFQFVKPLSAAKCHHNNRTYSLGQKWNDDCIQVCECVPADDTGLVAINACRARCPTYNDAPGVNCSLQRSKQDECCLEWLCDPDAKLAPQTLMTTTSERGQFNMSTTEIKLPSSSTLAALSSQQTTTIPAASQTASQANKVIETTNTNQQQQVPTTTSASISTANKPVTSAAATTLSAPQPMITTTPTAATITSSPPAASNRAPKQVTTLLERASQVLSQQQQQPRPTTSGEFGSRTIPDTQTTLTTTSTTTEASVASYEEADPVEVDLCIQAMDSGAYKVNQSWLEESCNQSCRCVFRSEPRDPSADVRIQQTINMKLNSEQTEIRCGLPPQCASVALKLTPSVECPNPRLVFPQPSLDRCACPRVTCAVDAPMKLSPSSRAPPTTTTTTTSTPPTSTTTTTTEPAKGCRSRLHQASRLLAIGETFNDECHSTCRCFEDGEIRCQQLVCPQEPQTDFSCPTGSEWALEQNFRPNSSENRCCPQFVCKESQQLQSRFKSCLLMGKETAHGERLPEEIHPRNPDAPCEKVCICQDGKIICQPLCPPLSDLPPDDLNCAPEQAYKTHDECCPKWICTIAEEYALQRFDVEPLNSTSVEINFMLPLIAVGRRGKAELNYTGASLSEASSLDQPPIDAQWIRKANIRTTDGVFSSQLVKYHMNNLKPSHKYWFKLAVHFMPMPESPLELALDEPLESQIERVVMPQAEPGSVEPPMPTSTTTTSTTTATPTRILRPVQPAGHSSVVSPVAIAKSATVQPPPTTVTQPSSTATVAASTTTTAVVTSSTTPAPTSTTSVAISSTSDQPSSTQTTTTTTTSTTTAKPIIADFFKPEIYNNNQVPPCSKSFEQTNQIDDRLPLPWTDHIQNQMNAPLQRYAWHLLVAFCVMTVLFTIVSYLLLKKSSRVIAPITSHQSAYDNPTFTKLVSYYANQPHVLLVDENNQNYNNDAILAKQKNLEVDKSSPLHHHQLNDIHHHNGRQHLI